jgi:hypothetical protein
VLAVLASMTKERGQVEGAPVRDGFPSLLRRARPRESRWRVSPLLWCVVFAALVVLPGVAWSAPAPDPPPLGRDGAGATTLQPDVPPAPPKSTPAAPSRPAEPRVAPRPADEAVQTPSAEAPVVSRSPEATVDQPATAPPPPPVAPRTVPSRPRPASAQRKPARESTPKARATGRPFASSQKPTRRPPRARVTRVPPRHAIALVSSDPDSGPYRAAALSLAVLVLGSATLLAVLTRLRPARRRFI